MHLRPVAIPSDESQAESWDGVTRPNGRGGANRQLTDLLVDLGLVSRDRVEDATSAARAAGTTPEEVLLERGDLTPDALSRAVAERHGLDHLDLSAFKVDMAAANLISTGSARRYVALPVAFVDERT